MSGKPGKVEQLNDDSASLASRVQSLSPGEYIIKLVKAGSKRITWQIVDMDKIKTERP